MTSAAAINLGQDLSDHYKKKDSDGYSHGPPRTNNKLEEYKKEEDEIKRILASEDKRESRGDPRSMYSHSLISVHCLLSELD